MIFNPPMNHQAKACFEFGPFRHSLVLVLAIFVNLERGGGLAGVSVAAAVAVFLAVASNVYLAMVLRPRMNYFRMKVASFDTVGRKIRGRHGSTGCIAARRAVLVLGWIAAAAGLLLWD